MMSRVMILVTIVIIIKSFSFINVTSSNQKDPAFTINIVSHTFAVSFLPTFLCMIVYATYKASDVSTFISTDNKTLTTFSSKKKGHHAVTIITFPVVKVIHIASVFSNNCHILD
ncbi:hypothetical protein V8G54_005866 [Vigna mungo]|uniref:Uncharacterized protein n=1 Tax=Vigna mungo TaxID=3915 RepID=A0AAQ3S7H8_VIGMU